jgi:hypothetical protein
VASWFRGGSPLACESVDTPRLRYGLLRGDASLKKIFAALDENTTCRNEVVWRVTRNRLRVKIGKKIMRGEALYVLAG